MRFKEEAHLACLREWMADASDDAPLAREHVAVALKALGEAEAMVADITEILCGARPVGVMAETTKDAAMALVADNAALLAVVREAHEAIRLVSEDDVSEALMDAQGDLGLAMARAHPGDALLEKHRKELARAKNDGLEMAAGVLAESHVGLKTAARIRALKERE